MKTTLYTLIFALVGLFSTLQASNQHTFTSADGSKTVKASIENYYPSKGTALLNINGRRVPVPVSAFQSEDKAKFDQWFAAVEIGRKLALSFSDDESEGVEKKTSNAKVTTYDAGFSIKVRNNSQAEFADVKLQYRLFYYRDKDKGGKEEAYSDGELAVAKIAPRETQEFNTEPVNLTKVRPLPATQCKGGG